MTLVSERVELTGWGRTAHSVANLFHVKTEDEVGEFLATPSRRAVLARGLGRSYGDAAQNAGGDILDLTALNRIHALDPSTGTVRVGAGRSVIDLLRALVPLGWFMPVVPGTGHVTIGGALAADIHGKNHHAAGSFGQHVLSFDLCLPGGDRSTVTPADDPDAFWATVGGMGLTGVVTAASMQLLPIESAWVRVTTERTANLDACMSSMAARDGDYRYSVAWVDCLARGSRLGRSVITRGEHASREELPRRLAASPYRYHPRALATVPKGVPSGLVNPLSVAAFNELWFRKTGTKEATTYQSIPSFFHPLDALASWNRLYGPGGFLQYQLVVPFGEEHVIRAAVEGVSSHRLPCFLTVLKRFGPQGGGHLSFPKSGWTLTMDFPARAPKLAPYLARLDELVVSVGGRVYFAKDARLNASYVPAMYPRLSEWRQVRDRLDPDRFMISALASRLKLLG